MDSKCRGTPLKHRLHRPKQTHSEKFFSSSSQEMVYITDSANGPKVLLGCTICNNKGTEKQSQKRTGSHLEKPVRNRETKVEDLALIQDHIVWESKIPVNLFL